MGLPEISLQSGVYDDLGDDRLNFGTPNGVNDVIVTAASAPNGGVSMVTSESFYPASATIRGHYSIAPATTIINGHPKTYHTIVNVSHQPKKTIENYCAFMKRKTTKTTTLFKNR